MKDYANRSEKLRIPTEAELHAARRAALERAQDEAKEKIKSDTRWLLHPACPAHFQCPDRLKDMQP